MPKFLDVVRQTRAVPIYSQREKLSNQDGHRLYAIAHLLGVFRRPSVVLMSWAVICARLGRMCTTSQHIAAS